MTPAEIDVRALRGSDLEAALDEVAQLRITVFRDWPYLYDGTLDYERQYLESYRDNPGALLVGAFHEGRLVGASTSTLSPVTGCVNTNPAACSANLARPNRSRTSRFSAPLP